MASSTSKVDFSIAIAAPDVTGSISGQKWNGEDGEGVKDPGESSLASWEIALDGVLTYSTIGAICTDRPSPKRMRYLLVHESSSRHLQRQL